MDANKLTKLKEIGYVVRKTCDNCEHIVFSRSPNGFSTCLVHMYNHQKHTKSKRELSVSAYGYCNQHRWRENMDAMLGGFDELKEDD